ncbi:MAG: nuclear transport factor 2 family protein [Dehalococcoidales bacterium]|jgi:hypothetical protein|nr:nuclear transport factor 2 family protein [Dehalococcoidales bacterium]
MSLDELERRVRSLERLKKKVRELEDLEAIKKLHRDYTYWMCQKQWDKMIECFAEDATADIAGNRFQNKAEIYNFFQNVLEKNIHLNDGHIVGQPVITVKGNQASGYWILYMFFPEPAMRWMQGRQDVEYVKIGGKWKFKKMKFVLPWPSPDDQNAKK